MRALNVRLAGLLVLAAVAAAGAPAAGDAYHFHAFAWPQGVIPYFNAAPDQAWAVSQAVSAWNDSGANVRFVPVPRAEANLVITENAGEVSCNEGLATIGDVPSAYVSIFPAQGTTAACNPYWAARVMTHELGHVLGLVHENRGCAEMNSTGNLHGGAACNPQPLWDWRCRLLEPDDVEGVISTYGGQMNPVKPQPLCPLYTAIAPPTPIQVAYNTGSTAMTVSFRRPSDPAIPSFVAPPQSRDGDAYAIGEVANACSSPTQPQSVARYHWTVAPGQQQTVTLPVPSQRTCIAVWADDAVGRPSDKPVQIVVMPAR